MPTWRRWKTRCGINLLPLATFAMDTYADDACAIFAPKMNFADANYNEKDTAPDYADAQGHYDYPA